MPELPEVENVVLSLIDKIKGRTITHCTVLRPNLIRKPTTASIFQADIEGQEIIHVEREGKYIVFRTTDYYLVCHLAMTGALLYTKFGQNVPAKYTNHRHVILQLDNDDILYYCDIRRFGGLRLLTPTEYHDFLPIQTLGPDPFSDYAFTLFKSNLGSPDVQKKTIKEVLLDQSVLSGIGNIYACEGLFAAKVNPTKLVSTITDIEIDKIFQETKTILQDSISKGGSSISDYMNADGVKGTYQNYLQVYGKKQCPVCNTNVSRKKIAERTTYYCSTCQK